MVVAVIMAIAAILTVTAIFVVTDNMSFLEKNRSAPREKNAGEETSKRRFLRMTVGAVLFVPAGLTAVTIAFFMVEDIFRLFPQIAAAETIVLWILLGVLAVFSAFLLMTGTKGYRCQDQDNARDWAYTYVSGLTLCISTLIILIIAVYGFIGA